MPRNGSGVYSPVVGSFSPAVNGQQAQAADFNSLLADLGSALTTSIASDGQTTITDDLPMSGYKHLDVDDAVLRNQYTALGQYMDGSMLYGTVGGTADAIELTFNPPFPALVEGMCVSWKNTNGPNTTAVTLKIDSNTTKDVKKNVSEALISGDLPDNAIVVARYDGTNFQVSSTATTGFTQFIESSIASATTTDLGSLAGNTALVTGTTTITSFGSSASIVRPIFFVRFSGILTLTHNGTSLILPTGANITTADGDSLVAEYLGSGNWKVLSYQRLSGLPLTPPSAATDTTAGVVELLTDAEFQTGTDTTRAATAANVKAGLGFTKYFESSQQSYTNGGTVTVAHGLGAVPFMVSAELVCLTAQGSFSIGDRQPLSPFTNFNGAANATNGNFRYNATNLIYTLTSNGIQDGGTTLTPGNFRIILKAWI